MGQVGACPVEHGHEVVADAVDALGRQVAQALLVDLNLLVAVRAAILDGLHHGQALDHRPPHAVALDVFAQVANLLAGPHLAQGRHYALHANLFQHGKRNLVLLAKPSPCSFHKCYFVLVVRFWCKDNEFIVIMC